MIKLTLKILRDMFGSSYNKFKRFLGLSLTKFACNNSYNASL